MKIAPLLWEWLSSTIKLRKGKKPSFFVGAAFSRDQTAL